MNSIRVDKKIADQRLDSAIFSLFSNFSRSTIKKLIKNEKIKVNDLPQKPGHRLKLKDQISIPDELTQEFIIPNIDLPILYEDDDVVVVYKPEGLLSHSKGSFNPEPTVASWLMPRVTDIVGDRAGIVHRLDRTTSGVMILAKNSQAQKWLQKQFSNRRVKKLYYALIEGGVDPSEAIIDMPIQRNPKLPSTFKVSANGKASLTHYVLKELGPEHALVELSPKTGRTHQLRVHLAKIKKPIVGDIIYGGKPADRLYLHAYSLELTLPNRQRKIFTSDMPASFAELLKGKKV